jgi:hypothetical protein
MVSKSKTQYFLIRGYPVYPKNFESIMFMN